MIGQRPEEYYDPETDIMGMNDLAFFKKLRKRVSKVFKPIRKARKKLVNKIRKPIVKFATKNMRGRRGRRLALVLGGPAALLLRKQIYKTVFSKKGLIHGRLPIPKRMRKVAKRIPVIRKMPGINRGYITPAMLRSKHALIPGYTIAREFKRKKRRRPAQVAAEASVQAAKSIANQQGQDFTQIMEQPQFQDLIEQRAIEMIKAQERDLMAQMTEAKKEQMVREAEINQWRVPSPPPPPVRGARDRESMLAQNQWAALNTMERMNIPPTPTNIRTVSKKVADRFAFNQAGELEAAKEEEKYIREELQAVQQAKRGVTTGMKVGGEWWGDEGFSPF
jgi:hypothetical protein